MLREWSAYWLRATGLWFLLMTAETLHGLWRVKVLAPWIGTEFAHEIGAFTGSLIILLLVFACIDWFPARNPRTLLMVGTTWVLLTVGYEAALGRLAFHYSWRQIVAEFDLSQGRLLPLGLGLLLVSPLLASWARGRIEGPARHAARPQT